MAEEPDNLVLVLLREIRGQVGEIRGQVSALDTKLDGLTDRVDSVDSKLNALTNRVEGIESRMSRLGASVSDLADSIDFVRKQLRVLVNVHDQDQLQRLEHTVEKIAERLAAVERSMIER